MENFRWSVPSFRPDNSTVIDLHQYANPARGENGAFTEYRVFMPDPYNDLQQSYGRCLRDRHFIDRFYAVLMESHPDIPAMFEHTDMGKQRVALRRGISVAILHAAGGNMAKRSVERMADVHSKTGHAPVAPHFYAYWLESLLKVIAETDRDADAALLARWRQAMGIVIDGFTARYNK